MAHYKLGNRACFRLTWVAHDQKLVFLSSLWTNKGGVYPSLSKLKFYTCSVGTDCKDVTITNCGHDAREEKID